MTVAASGGVIVSQTFVVTRDVYFKPSHLLKSRETLLITVHAVQKVIILE